MVWTVLTKERTFRKVSLAIQYRQRCNASSAPTSDAATNGNLSPTHPTTVSSVSPTKVSPTSHMHNASCSDNMSSPNIIQSYMDHHSTSHMGNQQAYMYGYHPRNGPPSIPQNRNMPSTTNPGCGYTHSGLSSDVEKKVQTHPSTFVMSNGVVVSNGNSSDQMTTATDEITSRYEDSAHWTNATSSTPWSLPFLSNSMSTLPPIQSSIHLRQRNIDNMNLNQRYHHHYNNHPGMNSSSSSMNLVPNQNQGRYNIDALYAPSTQPYQEKYNTHGNRHADGDNSDPIPISDMFAEPASNQNKIWEELNISRHSNSTHMIRSASMVSLHPQQSYNQNSSLLQEQRPYIRRVSNFNEHHPDQDFHHPSDANHNTSHGNDEVISSAGSLTTIEMKEFHHIQHDNSDTMTTVAADHTIAASSVSVGDHHHDADSIAVVAGDDDDDDKDGDCDDDTDDEGHRHKNENTIAADAYVTRGIPCNSISDSSTCSEIDGSSDSGSSDSILYNDLCLSPLWSTFSDHHNPFDHDDLPFQPEGGCTNKMMNHHNDLPQLPFF